MNRAFATVAAVVLAWPLTDSPYAAEVGIPDYSLQQNWIRCSDRVDMPVDVFFMHPTCYSDQADGMNASLANTTVNRAAESAVDRQASVFVDSCNLYAPRYRQASITVLDLPADEREQYLELGDDDMVAAFGYYLKHCNQGRPFALAGHSQGSNLILSFLRQHRDRVPYDRLVAVYAIGWSITDGDLKRIGLPLSGAPDQTGCVITWNTISVGGKSPVLMPGARCVNPLNWSTSPTEVPAPLNHYAQIRFKDGSTKRIPNFTSARIDPATGGLVIPVPSVDAQLDHGMGIGVYHQYDYDFFYGNLAENVKTRCNAWRARHR
jgi:pimeloyl-ACP methyl ester carboxylesterase